MSARRKPAVWSFPLYQEDDQARMAELKAALDNAERKVAEQETKVSTAARLGDDAPSPDALRQAADAAQQRLHDFITEVAERTFEVKWRAIGSRRYRDLRLAHPPRMVTKTVGEGDDAKTTEVVHEDDDGWGVNMDTFARALLAYCDAEDRIATIVEPEFESQDDRERFIDDEMSDGEVLQLFIQVIEANQGGTISPKALASRFASTPTSDET